MSDFSDDAQREYGEALAEGKLDNSKNTGNEYIDEAGFMPEIDIDINSQFIKTQSTPKGKNPFYTLPNTKNTGGLDDIINAIYINGQNGNSITFAKRQIQALIDREVVKELKDLANWDMTEEDLETKLNERIKELEKGQDNG